MSLSLPVVVKAVLSYGAHRLTERTTAAGAALALAALFGWTAPEAITSLGTALGALAGLILVVLPDPAPKD